MATFKTVKDVARIKPPASGRDEWFDTEETGLSLRVTSKGTRTWYVTYRNKNRNNVRRSIGRYPVVSLDDARKAARKQVVEEDERQKQGHPGVPKPAPPKFSELARRWVEDFAKVEKKSWKADQREIEGLLIPSWGNIRADELTDVDIKQLLAQIKNQGRKGRPAPIMANRLLALVSKIFNWAVEEKILDKSPCVGVKKPLRKELSRERVLSPEEIKDVWVAIEKLDFQMQVIFKLRLITAQRGGEVEAMRWRDIDMSNRSVWWWTIPQEHSKNKRSSRVPLSRPAQELLFILAAEREDSEWVFPSRRDSNKHTDWVQKAATRIREASGVDFVPHDLRRTAVSIMAGMDIPRVVLEKILNHTDEGSTPVYERHRYDEQKKKAMEAWARRIYEIIGRAYVA